MKKALIFIAFFLSSFCTTSNLFAHSPIKVLESTEEQLRISFSLPAYTIEVKDGFSFVRSPGMQYEEIAGKIDLPIYTFVVGIPSSGSFRYTIGRTQFELYDITAPIAPFPEFIKDPDNGTYNPIYKINKSVYLKELPDDIITVSEPYIWRNQRVINVTIHPFKFSDTKLEIYKNCSLNINFTGGEKQTRFSDKNFEKIFSKSILNFEIARNWSSNKIEYRQDNPFSHADRWFKIPIQEEGICKITRAQLSQAGIDVDNLDPSTIKVFNGGGFSQSRSVYAELYPFREIPVFVEEEGTDFTLYFYVRGTKGFKLNSDYDQYLNPYTDINTYWLTYNTDYKSNISDLTTHQTSSSKPEELSTYEYSQHFEEDKLRDTSLDITWFWQSFSGSANHTKEFIFTVSNLNLNEPQKITIKFSSRPNSYYYSAYLNDIEMTNFVWQGAQVTYTGNYLTNGTNTLRVECDDPSKIIYFDYYEIDYLKNMVMENNFIIFPLPHENTVYTVTIENASNSELHIFKINDFYLTSKIEEYVYNPQNNTITFDAVADSSNSKFCVVQNGGYLSHALTEKLKPTVYLNGYEQSSYLRDEQMLANTEAIIITVSEFYEKAKELVDAHVLYDGLNVLLVDIEDVYDEFSWGVKDVVAVRYFLKYGYNFYGLDPEEQLAYVLLAGDGTNDFRGIEPGSAERNKILPFINGTVASDDYYAYFATKYVPSLMIGRFPGYTTAQMDIMIDKSVEFLAEPNFNFWRNRVILSADDFLKQGHHTEPSHTSTAEICSRKIQNNVEVLKNYGIMYPLDEFQNRPEANEELIKMINDGAAIFYYIGHGGYDVIGDEEYFRASRDITKLTNGNKLNFFLASSCDIGLFDSNSIECMAERMIYAKDKGSIAVFASTRKGGYGPCSDVVDLAVNNAHGHITIGEAVIMSKGGTPIKSYDMYNLFGDPMLRSAIPPIRGSVSIPDVLPDSLKARQTAEFSGIIDTTGYTFSDVFNVVFDTDYTVVYYYDWWDPINEEWVQLPLDVVHKGKPIFKGPVSSEGNNYDLGFVVPDDVYGGQEGHILSYAISADNMIDLTMRYNKRSNPADHKLIINGYANSENDGPPRITLWLDRDSFKDGDYVSSTPLLHAEIVDSNGINITNYPGHRILLTIDNNDEYNVTEYFVYDLDSYVQGMLEYQLEELLPGDHTLKIEVFDNFNEGTYAEVDFKIKEPDKIDVNTVLNYPNPMSEDTYFTFYLDGDATVDIEIYTVTGKKIKVIKDEVLRAGYNQVYWNGLDADGDRPSNGIYFYKLIVNNKRINDNFKLIIFH
ncbi:MAG TPA: type IX secretion system sortase PorU [Candidatus Cloacimonetes bacterium]|nr:type IX secretion system sortase PorU [Candidatus Cloacimonadota bacterium]HEX37545.1 type IX secretion system sortase PorU [Candidatus Cloacimonadota bacterium]